MPEKLLYCIEVTREIEEMCVIHHTFDAAPTRDDVLQVVMDADLNYDDNYGKIRYYEIVF